MNNREPLAFGAALALLLGASLTAPLPGVGPQTAAAQDRAELFRVDFTAQPDGDGARITGYVYNTAGKAADDVQLRIIELDSSGYAMASYVEPMLEMVPAMGRAPFDVKVPSDAASYRVIVDSWKTVEEPAK
jgi:hypothetical protein